MGARATLVATLTEPPAADGRSLAALGGLADLLEVRADLVGDLDAAWLRSHFPGRLLYTLRSRAEGGAFEGSRERRRRRIGEAASAYDLVDLEAERDASDDLLATIPAERRILSWHGAPADLETLRRRFSRMASVPAALYKLVTFATAPGEELASLELAADSRRRDLLSFAAGASAAWTRLLAPRLGAPWVYGAASETPGAPGQPTVARLRADFGLPELGDIAWIAGLIGNPVAHSLSPRLHNGGYRALGLAGLYLPFHVERFADFWLEIVESGIFARLGMPLRAFSVTTPHKEVAMAVAGAASPLAVLSGSANTLLFADGVCQAETTDAVGVAGALRALGRDPARLAVAVVGAGGAGRAVAAGLAHEGARVTLVNRTYERAREVARDLRVQAAPLDGFRPRGFDVLVNATSIGRDGEGLPPVALAEVATGTVVVDLVYGDEPTPWLSEAMRRGLPAVDGREVLLQQARPQFYMTTGCELPPELGREVLGLPAPGVAPGAAS